MPLGPTELIIILVIVLVLFGAKRLPGLGRDLGTGMREFKDSVTAKDGSSEREPEQIEARREPPISPTAPGDLAEPVPVEPPTQQDAPPRDAG